MNERYLPIGSVVELKNGKKVMVTGYYSVEYENDIMVYDYSGCAYPEGVMRKSSNCSFNHRDISNTLFIGYQGKEYIKMTNKLNMIEGGILSDEEPLKDETLDKNEKPEEQLEELETLHFDSLDTNKEDDEFQIPHYVFDENGIIIKD